MTARSPLAWPAPIGRALRRLGWLPAPRPRHQYKEVWNALAADEDGAKRAVSGGTSEAEYRASAELTVRTLRETVGIRPDDVVLEIGAGVGRVGALLAPACREWIGVDVSENMLAHARRRLAGAPNARFVPSNGFDLSGVASASVTVVYSTVVFMHLDEWDRYGYVREAARVLKPGGRLYVDNFNLASDEGWALFEQLARLPPGRRPPYISKMSTAGELAVYLGRAGFGAVQQRAEGLWIMTWGTKPEA